jgi:hypothetical protein
MVLFFKTKCRFWGLRRGGRGSKNYRGQLKQEKMIIPFIAWKKKVFRSKTKILDYVDTITTDLPKRRNVIL